MNSGLILIPLSLALIGALSFKFYFYLLFHWILPFKQDAIRLIIVQNLQELINKQAIASKIHQIDLEKEISPLLDQRLTGLVEKLKGQIPMGEYFLTGILTERLKTQAKEEIFKILPEIKEQFIDKIEGELNLKQMIKKRVQELKLTQIESFIKTEMRENLNKLSIIGALIGLLVGLFELLLVFLFR